MHKNEYRSDVLQKTTGEIRTFLDALANGTTHYRSLHNLTEQVEHQYHGRFIIELLQNAHDVLPEKQQSDKPSRISIIIEEDETPYGSLYVANDGQPFSPSNFKSLSALGQSDKNPGKSIGNKGIGFRSVLEITSEPHIYSRFSEYSPAFDGYCFKFSPEVANTFFDPIRALLRGERGVMSPISTGLSLVEWTDKTYRAVCEKYGSRNDAWLRSELAYLSPYLLPLPLTQKDMTPRTAALEQEGYSTVIRLPFKNREARQLVTDKMAELNINTTLFLERVSLLNLETAVTRNSVRRLTKSRGDNQNGREVVLELFNGDEITESKRYWFWDETLGGDEQPLVLKELAAAVINLPGSWKEMTSATVSIAVRIADKPEPGYFNIYLPTELSTGCCAHISAPFYGDMSRTNINFSDPLNQFLLRKAADKAVQVVLESLAGKGHEEGRAIIDILAPVDEKKQWYDLWTKAFPEKFYELPLCYSEKKWSPLDETSLIPETKDSCVLTEEIWHNHATFSIFSGALKTRYENIRSLYKSIGSDAIPAEEDILDTLEKIAEWHHTSGNKPDWAGFWNDVINTPMWERYRSVKRTADSLKGRRILLGNDNELHSSNKECTIFFPPLRASIDEVDEQEIQTIPAVFRSSMAFLDEGLALNKTLRPFFANGLVQDFRVDDIFKLVLVPRIPVLPVALKSTEGNLCKDLLRWALRLTGGMADRGKGKQHIAELMAEFPVPCRGGWFSINEAHFGPGWSGTTGDDLRAYLEGADSAECRALLKQLVIPLNSGDNEKYKEQFKDAGVTDGLKQIKATNSLPGLDRYDAFDDSTRLAFMRLVFVLLQQLEESWQTLTSNSAKGGVDMVTIESALSSSLRTLSWIGCDKNGLIEWVRPDERWYVPHSIMGSRGRQFVHLNPLTNNVARLLQNKPALEKNLAALGMPRFDPEAQTDDPRLLNRLAVALQVGDVADRYVFISHIHDAWRTFRPTEGAAFPDQIIVNQSSQQLDVVSPTEQNPVYLPNSTPASTNALIQCGLPVLCIAEADASELENSFRANFGNAVHMASDLKNWPSINGLRWTKEADSWFSESEIGWLAPVILAIFAFAGNKPNGVLTKTFVKAIQLIRTTHIHWVNDLEIGLWQDQQLVTSHPVAAFWMADEKVLLCENNCRQKLSLLSDAFETLLDRSDLKTALKLVLGEIERQDQPSVDDICCVLQNALDIRAHQFYSVSEQWQGDVSHSLRLLAPVVLLCRTEQDLPEFADVSSQEDLRAYVQNQMVCSFDKEKLLQLIKSSDDFSTLGRSLFELDGEVFHLAAWNSALDKIGEKPVLNCEGRNEFRQHLALSFVPLRALLLSVLERTQQLASFSEFSNKIDDLEFNQAFAEQHWCLPYSETMRIVAILYAEYGASHAECDALATADSIDRLKANLTALKIDTSNNPFETQKLNRENFRNSLEYLQSIAIAWCLKENRTSTAWEQPIDDLLQGLWEKIEARSYSSLWSESTCFDLVKLFPRIDNSEGFWQRYDAAGDMDSFVAGLGISAVELTSAEESLETCKDKNRRENRTVLICGESFDSSEDNLKNLREHILRTITPESLTAIDATAFSSLKGMSEKKAAIAGFDRAISKVIPKKKRISNSLETLIGLTGETLAYHFFLPSLYGKESVNQNCWVSSNSAKEYPDKTFDDGFGCDFVITVEDKTYYVEVKATQGTDEFFQLGSSEVQLAMAVLAKGRRIKEEFWILHITNALSEKPIPRMLPNPYHPSYKQSYQIDNAGVRVRYQVVNDQAD